MKRIILFLAVLLITGLGSLVILSPQAKAVDLIGPVCQNQGGSNNSTVCQDNCVKSASNPNPPPACASNPIFGPDGIMTVIMQLFALLTGMTAVIVLIVAGMRMGLAQGDSNSFASARQAVIYALIGLGVAASAQLLVSFVLAKL